MTHVQKGLVEAVSKMTAEDSTMDWGKVKSNQDMSKEVNTNQLLVNLTSVMDKLIRECNSEEEASSESEV